MKHVLGSFISMFSKLPETGKVEYLNSKGWAMSEVRGDSFAAYTNGRYVVEVCLQDKSATNAVYYLVYDILNKDDCEVFVNFYQK